MHTHIETETDSWLWRHQFTSTLSLSVITCAEMSPSSTRTSEMTKVRNLVRHKSLFRPNIVHRSRIATCAGFPAQINVSSSRLPRSKLAPSSASRMLCLYPQLVSAADMGTSIAFHGVCCSGNGLFLSINLSLHSFSISEPRPGFAC